MNTYTITLNKEMEKYKIKVMKNINGMNRKEIENNLYNVYCIARRNSENIDDDSRYNLYRFKDANNIYFESNIYGGIHDKIRNEMTYNDLSQRIYELKYIKIVDVKELDEFLELTVEREFACLSKYSYCDNDDE